MAIHTTDVSTRNILDGVVVEVLTPRGVLKLTVSAAGSFSVTQTDAPARVADEVVGVKFAAFDSPREAWKSSLPQYNYYADPALHLTIGDWVRVPVVGSFGRDVVRTATVTDLTPPEKSVRLKRVLGRV